ncbi:MAG: hypothetical protein R3190_15245, partial [Thermoanaerobaculia bacterium]|nr:hypothetical protein [Thermoanaerobaculia bacterium]
MRRVLRRVLPILAVGLVALPAAAEIHVVIISGLGGEEEYSDLFHDWSSRLAASAVAAGIPDKNVLYLAEDPDRDPELIDGPARGDEIRRRLADLEPRLGADDELWIVLFGHGSGRSGDAKVSLPGPDMGGSDFAAALAPLRAGTVVFVNCASASGDFVPALSGPGRVVVTATRSAGEQHAPTFGGFFVEGFEEARADVDKDQRVSILEAFEYARKEVERRYEGLQLMLTEHALLDDNGDSSGSLEAAAGGEGGDGAVASRVFLGRGTAAVPATATGRSLLARKEALEDRIAELRSRRATMEEAAYLAELEELLLELAATNRDLR